MSKDKHPQVSYTGYTCKLSNDSETRECISTKIFECHDLYDIKDKRSIFQTILI